MDLDPGQDSGSGCRCVITSYSIHYTKLYEEFNVSARFESMLGYEQGERTFTSESLHQYIHPDDLMKARVSLEQHIKSYNFV